MKWMTEREYKDAACRSYWETLLVMTRGNITQAGRIAGVNRTDVYKHLTRYGVQLNPRPHAHRGSWGI